MELYNRTNTMVRLAGIYNEFCSHPETIGKIVYSILGYDQNPGITYNKQPLTKLSGMSYSRWNFIPDDFEAQDHFMKIAEEVKRDLHGQSWEVLIAEYTRRVERLNLDDAYGDGDYFRRRLNSEIQSDERIIINADTQQNALFLVKELINSGFNFISTIKFIAKSPRVSQPKLKCDKMVVYYQKGAGDGNRTVLLDAIQRIRSARGINMTDCLSAFYHKAFPGIGYAVEVGGDSFTTRIERQILEMLNTSASSLPDVKFDGNVADRCTFANEVFGRITQSIENRFR